MLRLKEMDEQVEKQIKVCSRLYNVGAIICAIVMIMNRGDSKIVGAAFLICLFSELYMLQQRHI